MRHRVDTTWELDSGDMLSVCDYDRQNNDMVSLSNFGWPSFTILLRPAHIPKVEELLAALIAKRDAVKAVAA